MVQRGAVEHKEHKEQNEHKEHKAHKEHTDLWIVFYLAAFTYNMFEFTILFFFDKAKHQDCFAVIKSLQEAKKIHISPNKACIND